MSFSKLKSAAVVIASLGFVLSASAQAWKDAIKAQVPVTVFNRGDLQGKPYIFVDFIDDSLLLRSPSAQNQREMIAFPIAQFVPGQMKSELRANKTVEEAFKQLTDPETAADAIGVMRRTVWPLTKVIDIAPSQTDFDEYIDAYLNALIATETANEAKALVRLFDYSKITPSQTRAVVKLVELFLQKERSEDAFRLLGRLPLNEDRKDLQDIAVRFGKQLRDLGRYQDAVSVYEKLFTLEKSDFRQKSILWTSYCYLKLGNLESANIYLSLADDFGPRDQEFSLKRLIEGLILLESGDATKAMHSISEGVVFSRLGLEWISELMLLSGKAYEAVGRPQVAVNVYKELIQFYPEDRFAKEAEQRLADLTDATQSDAQES